MKTLKAYAFHIIAIISALIGGLLYLLSRKSKQIDSLRGDIDLTVQKESSKVVDEKVNSAQKEVDALSQEMKKPVSDEFWKDYTEDKKK